MNQLYREKHIKYFNRVLGYLPSKYESEDSNKLALIYFSLTALDLLGAVETSFKEKDRKEFIEWIYAHLCFKEDGFRGSLVYKTEAGDEFDRPNLAATCFALQILLALRDPGINTRLNRAKIMDNVIRCQDKTTGGFCAMLDIHGEPYGEIDVRYGMLATTIRKILNWDDESKDIDANKLYQYVQRTKSFDGGIGQNSFMESHSGLTFCGLVALKNIGKLDEGEWQDTLDFLVHRQISQLEVEESEDMDLDDVGGFNGRINKYSDTCYCFWVIASLRLLGGREDLIARGEVLKFLLEGTQHGIMGGFTKIVDEDDQPDPLHSFLGLAVLSILGYEGLDGLNTEMVVSNKAYEFWKSIQWR